MMTPLTADVVLDVIQNLSVAFAGKRTADDLKRLSFVYFDALGSLSAESVRWAAKRVIREDTYFPKVARLIELGQKWETSERAHSQDVVGSIFDPMMCPNCHTRYEWQQRWRPVSSDMREGPMHWFVSSDANYLLLEGYDRLLCACSARCAYVPDPRLSVPAMPVGSVAMLLPIRRVPTVVEVAA